MARRRISSRRFRIGWYTVSVDTVWTLGKLLLTVAVVVAGYQAYVLWDEYTIERRASETLNGARGLMRTLRTDSDPSGYRQELARASSSLEEAEAAWERGSYRSALFKAQVSRGLLLDIVDARQNPGRRGEARFIYVEGQVEYRRGETGRFRPARPRDVLYEGDYVRSSARGSAEILFDGDGTLFTVRSGTMLKVQRSLTLRSRQEPVRMEYGWVDLETSRRPSGVETEYAALRLHTDSLATVTYEEQSATSRFALGKGGAEVSAPGTGEVRRLQELEQLVQKAESLGTVTSLIGRPEPTAPVNNFDLNLDRAQQVTLAWRPVEDAGGYQLQVARNRLFSEKIVDRRRSQTSATLAVSGEGNFYWRVAALGEDDVLGPWSPMRKFRVVSLGGLGWRDTVPPVLEIADVNVNGQIVIVTGRTEPGVKLEIAGQRASVAADGSFRLSVIPERSGLVDLVIAAVDPSGNRSATTRQVYIETL